jgi:alkylated DNA repair dioxygenase AlkB
MDPTIPKDLTPEFLPKTEEHEIITRLDKQLFIPQMDPTIHKSLTQEFLPETEEHKINTWLDKQLFIPQMDPTIPEGLYLILEFLTETEEHEIITWLDKQLWSTALSRRTQHYGYIYDYTRKNVQATPTIPISGPLQKIAERLINIPTQCIVNEYTRNQGIAPHIDSLSFGPIIISISLNADTIMTFTKPESIPFECLLPRRSIVILSGPARYQYKHSINKKVTYIDPITNLKVTKPSDYRRISLTYRTLS